MENMFDRNEKLLGKDVVEKLSKLSVLVVGVGGVGSYSVEALARLGIGHLILVDKDIVDITNINRQIIALNSNVGKTKVEEAKKRILDINPDCHVDTLNIFIDKDNIDVLDGMKIDYAIDAIDSVYSKLALIKWCQKNNVKEIVCGGMGKRRDPSKLVVAKLNQTSGDPICKKLRELVKQEGLIMSEIRVIYSLEKPTTKKEDGPTPSSVVFVPAYAGLLSVHWLLEDLLGVKKQ